VQNGSRATPKSLPIRSVNYYSSTGTIIRIISPVKRASTVFNDWVADSDTVALFDFIIATVGENPVKNAG
jgi:hypothetical protein